MKFIHELMLNQFENGFQNYFDLIENSFEKIPEEFKRAAEQKLRAILEKKIRKFEKLIAAIEGKCQHYHITGEDRFRVKDLYTVQIRLLKKTLSKERLYELIDPEELRCLASAPVDSGIE